MGAYEQAEAERVEGWRPVGPTPASVALPQNMNQNPGQYQAIAELMASNVGFDQNQALRNPMYAPQLYQQQVYQPPQPPQQQPWQPGQPGQQIQWHPTEEQIALMLRSMPMGGI